MKLTNADRAILTVVQEDGGVTIDVLAERAGLSKSAAQRRLRRLHEERLILRNVAIVDQRRVGSAPR